MNESARILTLLSELDKSRSVLARIVSFYDRYREETQDAQARTTEQAIVLAEILVNYYTYLCNGAVSEMHVPAPGALRISTRPSRKLSRSRMENRPNPPPAGASGARRLGSNPAP